MPAFTLLQKARAIVTAYTNKEWNEDRKVGYLASYEIDSRDYLAASLLMHYYKHEVEAVVLSQKIASLYGSEIKPGLQLGLQRVNIIIDESDSLPTLAQVVNFLSGIQVVTMSSENDLEKDTKALVKLLLK